MFNPRGEQPIRFRDIRSLLDPCADEFLELSDQTQANLNLSSLTTFSEIMEPLVLALKPASIVEIGADYGLMTEVLIAWAKKTNAHLTVVDTNDRSLPEESENSLNTFCGRSLDYLKGAPPAHLYVIDGDHNYYTVSGELDAIANAVEASSSQSTVVFLHDVTWPGSRYDMFYDLSNVPEQGKRRLGDSSLSLLGRVDRHFAIPFAEVAVASGADNEEPVGAKVALKEFLAARPQWQFVEVPVAYGLAVLVRSPEAAPQRGMLAAAFRDLERSVGMMRPLLLKLEFNRLLLLHEAFRQGDIFQEMADYISQLEATANAIGEEEDSEVTNRSASAAQGSVGDDRA